MTSPSLAARWIFPGSKADRVWLETVMPPVIGKEISFYRADLSRYGRPAIYLIK